MTCWNIYLRLIFALFIIFLNTHSYAQQKLSEGEQDVKNKAYQFFNDDNYAEALPLFSRLLSIYPKDPEFNYAYGVCLVEENKDLDKALQYFNFTLKNTLIPGAIYYTGRVWHMKYKFDEALSHYKQFKEKAKKDDLKKFPVDRQIKMCQSGKELIRYVSILNVEENKLVKSKDFYYSYNIDDFGGKILVKPEEFKTKSDKKKEKNSENKSLMFLSTELNVVYYSSYGDNDKNGKDIYRKVKDNATGEWMPAENLGAVINTTYDEDFPYIHPDGSTLYFASKGHNSMGGYDIFKSSYDWETNIWSAPVNLDFPTNSPYDDILYISDSKEDIAYFASNRESGYANVSVYRIKIEKKPRKKEIENFEEIIRKSKLEVVSPMLSMKDRDENIKITEDKNQGTTNNNFKEGKYTFNELTYSEKLTQDEVYQEADNDAKALNNESKEMQKMAAIVMHVADNKNQEADEKLKEYEKVKTKDKSTAEKIKKEADKATREAVISFKLALNLKNISEDKKKDAKDADDFLKELSFNKKREVKDLVSDLNAHRKKISRKQKNYTTVEKEMLNAKVLSTDLGKQRDSKTAEVDAIKNVVIDVEKKIETAKSKIKNEINTATKIKLEEEIKDQEILLSSKKKQEQQLLFELEQIDNKTSTNNNDIALYEGLIQEMNSGKTEYTEPEKLVAAIDNNKLTKAIEIKSKEIGITDTSNNIIAENKTTKDTKEPVDDKNIKIEKNKDLLVSNVNYKTLIEEAEKSEKLADSLTLVIESSSKNAEKIKDPDKKQEELNKIENLKTIADFKKQDAEKKYAQANEIGNTYIALNEIEANKNKQDDKTTDNKTNNIQETDVKENKDLKKDETNQNISVSSGIVMKSVLAEKEQKQLRNDNPAYNKVLNEANKALSMADSLTKEISTKKTNLDKIKNPADKQAEQEKISNMENIANFKRELAEKRFVDVNQHEKSFLISNGKSVDIFAENKTEQTNLNTTENINDANKKDDTEAKDIKETKTTETDKNVKKEVSDPALVNEMKAVTFVSTLVSKEQNTLEKSNKEYKELKKDIFRSHEIADSLFLLADNKKKALAKIKDPKKKQAEEEKINNLENIAVFKKQDALKKTARLKETEQEYFASVQKEQKENLSENNTEKIKDDTIKKENNIAENKTTDSKQDNPELKKQNEQIEKDKVILEQNTSYTSLISEAKKAETRADSLSNVAEELKKDLKTIEKKKDKQKAEELIAVLEKSVKKNQEEAEAKFKQANDVGTQYLAETKAKEDSKLADNKTSEIKKDDTIKKESDNSENNNPDIKDKNKFQTDNKTADNTVTEKSTASVNLTETEKKALAKDTKFTKLITESNKNNHISDSLFALAKTKKKNLDKIKNAQEKQAEQDQITNIESIAKFKKEYAVKKINEANEYGKATLESNPALLAEANNKKEDEKITKDNEVKKTKDGTTDLTEKGNVTEKDIAEIKEAMTKKINEKQNADKEKTDKQKTEEKKNLADNKDNKTTDNKITENKEAKKNIADTKKTDDKTQKNITPVYKGTLSEKEQEALKTDEKFTKLAIEAQKANHVSDSLYTLAENMKKKLPAIKNVQEKQAEQDKIANIESIAKFKNEFAVRKFTEADEYGKDLLASNNPNNTTTENKDIVAENKQTEKKSTEVKNDTEIKKEVSTENKIVNETKKELLKDDKYSILIAEGKKEEVEADSLAYIIIKKKQNLNEVKDDKEKTKIQNEIAQLEKSSETKRQNAEQKYAAANNMSNDLLAEKKADTNTESQSDILKAPISEQDKFCKENTEIFKKKESDALASMSEANNLFDKLTVSVNESDKNKTRTELKSKIEKAKKELIEAYKVKSNVDLIKNTMLATRLEEMITLPEVSSNKQIAQKYKDDAANFRKLAEKAKTNAANASDINEKLSQFKRALDYEQLAIKSHETAVDVLMESKPVTFVPASELLTVNTNDAYMQIRKVEEEINNESKEPSYNKDNVKNEIVTLLSKKKETKTILDDLTKQAASTQKEMTEIAQMESLLIEYKANTENATDEKEKIKAEKRLNEHTKKLYKKKYGIAQQIEKENQQLYNVYLKNSLSLRPDEDSPALIEGMKLEAQSSVNFNKAKEIRDKVSKEQDPLVSVPELEKAASLELLALSQQEKAYGIYLKIIPVEKQEEKLIADVKKDEKKDNTEQISEIKKDEKKENIIIEKKEEQNIIPDKKETKENNVAEINETKKETKTTETKKQNKLIADVKKEDKEKKYLTEFDEKKKEIINVENVKPEKRLATSDKANINYGFSIQPKKHAEENKEIPMNEAVPSGIVYKVQVGAFKTPIPADAFAGLNPLACEKLEGSAFVKYLVGLFKTEDAAKIARAEVRKSGYKDAFIVAYKDGVRIPLYLARNTIKSKSKDEQHEYKEIAKNEVENVTKNINESKAAKNTLVSENVNKNKEIKGNSKTTEKNKQDIKEQKEIKEEKENIVAENKNQKEAINKEAKKTIPNAVKSVNVKEVKGLLYTVQIGVFRNPRTAKDLYNLSPIFEETIMLGGIEAIKYTNGIFSDYLEAVAAKDNIVRMGIKDAYIVVYFNGKTIPLNQANVMLMNQGASVIADPKSINVKSGSNAGTFKNEVQNKNTGKLVYKVQIGAHKGNVPEDLMNKYMQAAQYGSLSDYMENELKCYLIGEFNTYKDALKMKDKLIEIGIERPFVVGLRGGQKVTVKGNQ